MCFAFPTPKFVNARSNRTLRAGGSSADPPAIPAPALRAKALKQSNRLFLAEAYSVGSTLCQAVSLPQRGRSRWRDARRQVHKYVLFGSSVKSLSSCASFPLLPTFRQIIGYFQAIANSTRHCCRAGFHAHWSVARFCLEFSPPSLVRAI